MHKRACPKSKVWHRELCRQVIMASSRCLNQSCQESKSEIQTHLPPHKKNFHQRNTCLHVRHKVPPPLAEPSSLCTPFLYHLRPKGCDACYHAASHILYMCTYKVCLHVRTVTSTQRIQKRHYCLHGILFARLP